MVALAEELCLSREMSQKPALAKILRIYKILVQTVAYVDAEEISTVSIANKITLLLLLAIDSNAVYQRCTPLM